MWRPLLYQENANFWVTLNLLQLNHSRGRWWGNLMSFSASHFENHWTGWPGLCPKGKNLPKIITCIILIGASWTSTKFQNLTLNISEEQLTNNHHLVSLIHTGVKVRLLTLTGTWNMLQQMQHFEKQSFVTAEEDFRLFDERQCFLCGKGSH